MNQPKCQECGIETNELSQICPNCLPQPAPTDQAYALNLTYNRLFSGFLFWGGAVWLAFNAVTLGPSSFSQGLKWAGGTMAIGAFYYLLGETTRNLAEKRASRKE